MKIALLAFEGVGHLNPQLALASKLVARGHSVCFFLASNKNEDAIRALPFPKEVKVCVDHDRGSVDWKNLDPSDAKVSGLVLLLAKITVEAMPRLLDELRAWGAELIIYDAFVQGAPIAAKVLNIPCCCTVTITNVNGYTLLEAGDLGETEAGRRQVLENHRNSKTLAECRKVLLEKYGYDIFSHGIMLNSYLPTGLQVCTGIKEFEQEMPEVVRDIYGDIDKECVYVGPMLISKEEGRIASQEKLPKKQWIDDPFPYDRLRQYEVEEGRKIIYAAFGTVATGPDHWDMEKDPTVMFGARSSGKKFCRTMWQRIIEAFGNKENFAVVMATCSQDPEALAGLDIPGNFIVRRRCPQLEVLKVADAFITHGGANSTIESITAHVPMLCLPWFSDQPSNGKMITREGIGLHYLNPVAECTAQFLERDVGRLLADREAFVDNCKRLDKCLKEAGGAQKAAERIEAYVANFRGHRLPSVAAAAKPPNQLQQCGSFKKRQRAEDGGDRETVALHV